MVFAERKVITCIDVFLTKHHHNQTGNIINEAIGQGQRYALYVRCCQRAVVAGESGRPNTTPIDSVGGESGLVITMLLIMQ